MVRLSKEVLNKFYHGLEIVTLKSDFDQTFLNKYNLHALYDLELEDFIPIFSERLQNLRDSDFDWTKIGLATIPDWSIANDHVNYYWYHLAIEIVILNGAHITKVIFPSVVIFSQDLRYLTTARSFSFLIYTDNFERLMILNRMLQAAENDVNAFGNYDARGKGCPVSIFELLQIRNKLTNKNLFYRAYGVNNWEEFTKNYLSIWKQASPVPRCFDDLIYPLFKVVENYFSELADQGSGLSTKKLIEDFYKDHLNKLRPQQINYFYGQAIPCLDNPTDYVYLIDILLDSLSAPDLMSIQQKMVNLALWISEINPAMVILHPLVMQCYQNKHIGPYFNLEQLSQELIILLRTRSELSEDLFVKLDSLHNFLYEFNPNLVISSQFLNEGIADTLGAESSEVLFNLIVEIFKLRDQYNCAETFIDRVNEEIVTVPFHYIYHQKGANSQFIRIARLLFGCGFLQQHRMDDYFRLLMPCLTSFSDPVTGVTLSTRPFSHYVFSDKRPYELIYLGNALENFKINGCFYNVDGLKVVPFTVKQYKYIQYYAAQTFRNLPRLPKRTQQVLQASTLKELVDLVNHSLIHKAAEDGDGYELKEGFSSYLPINVIEFERDNREISYKMRDSWNPFCVHVGNIFFQNSAELRAFLFSTNAQRLMFILKVAVDRGHARANMSMAQYVKACTAYTLFRQFYLALESGERNRLDTVCMRYYGAASARTFSDVWENGFPNCMSAASRWFSAMILDYLPQIRFCDEIENNPKYNQYLSHARKESQHLYRGHINNDLNVSLPELIQSLTPVSTHGINKFCEVFFNFLSPEKDTLDADTKEILLTPLTLFSSKKSTDSHSFDSTTTESLSDNSSSPSRTSSPRTVSTKIANTHPVSMSHSFNLNQDEAATSEAKTGLGFFQFKTTVEAIPITNPQKAAPMPNKDIPEADTKMVMIPASR